MVTLRSPRSRSFAKIRQAAGCHGCTGGFRDLNSSREELTRGIRDMLGKTLRSETTVSQDGAIVLGTIPAIRRAIPGFRSPVELRNDAFWITHVRLHRADCIVVTAANDRGVLYGVFFLLRAIARNQSTANLDELQQPYAAARWVDQWGQPRWQH